MMERGLLPDFSAGASSQAQSLSLPAAAHGSDIRDLRLLLWASIDNDDSRDLDQLSVAQPLAGGAVKILVAIADVDALVPRYSPIDEHARPSLRRVLRIPKKWNQIVARAAELGETLPAEPSATALNAFLGKRRRVDPARFADLSLCIIKLLGRGEYQLDIPGGRTPGHFGLAVGDYTHSTAPNRRFPDLLTERMLKSTLLGTDVPYAPDELSELAAHCTAQEDNAAKVERQIAKSAAALLLAPRIGRRFDAIVTGAADKGTWARISSPTAEGKVVKGFEGLKVGDHVAVKLLRTDVARGFIDFERVR